METRHTAGRFYKAFYRWTQCTAPSHASPHSSHRATSLHPPTKLRCNPPTHHPHRYSSTQPSINKTQARLGAATSNVNIHPDLSTHMRQIMRKVPHPVVVITAASPSSPEASASPEHTFRGMTISSFNTVALAPTPLISFNLKLPSATYTALAAPEREGTFLAHLLVSSPAGARIADAFARGGNREGEVFAELATGSVAKSEGLQIFAGKGTQGAPLLAGDGVMQVLRCRLLEGKEVDVGDHKVVVAEVLGIVAHPRRRKVEEKSMGLCYADQRYRELGEAISVGAGDEGEQIPGQSSEEDVEMQRTMGLNVRRGDEGR